MARPPVPGEARPLPCGVPGEVLSPGSAESVDRERSAGGWALTEQAGNCEAGRRPWARLGFSPSHVLLVLCAWSAVGFPSKCGAIKQQVLK